MSLTIWYRKPPATPRRSRGRRHGFSLVEVLGATVICAILAGISVPLYANSRRAGMGRECTVNPHRRSDVAIDPGR